VDWEFGVQAADWTHLLFSLNGIGATTKEKSVISAARSKKQTATRDALVEGQDKYYVGRLAGVVELQQNAGGGTVRRVAPGLSRYGIAYSHDYGLFRLALKGDLGDIWE
jgi:hypothetical protein